MDPSLLTLPFRVGVAATRLALRPVTWVGGAAIELIDHVLGDPPSGPVATSSESDQEPVFSGPAAREDEPAKPEPAPPEPPSPPPPPVTAEEGPVEPLPGPEPAHVSEEPELVAESADAGAVDGSSAELTVEEPWDGYHAARAREVIDSLPTASREELAVIDLYESTHRARKSVLAAVERELKVKSPPRRNA
jgi:hypothetical protein